MPGSWKPSPWRHAKFCRNRFPDFQDSLELRRSKWNTNLYFLGTYSYHGLSSDGIEDPTEGLREPIMQSGTARLLFAGEATHRAHFSTVHGAVESGWREADRVLDSSNLIINPHFLGTYSYHGLRSDRIEDPTAGLGKPNTHFGTARLLFAGKATHCVHFSTVQGAVESGWKGAGQVLHNYF